MRNRPEKSNSRGDYRGRNRDKSQSLNKKLLFVLILVAILAVAVYKILPPPPPPPPPPPRSVGPIEAKPASNAYIYVDNSVSMKGYADADPPNMFIDILSQLMGEYRKGLKVYAGNNELNTPNVIDSFRQDHIHFIGESFLYKDIAKMCEEGQNHICFYITDGIMSGSNEQIRKDPACAYNKINATHLQNNVSGAFNSDTKKQLGVSVYQFKANFSGKYSCYDNTNINFKEKERYLYVIVIGRREWLADFKQRVDSKKEDRNESFKFKPVNQWHAIDVLPLSTNPYIGPSGAVTQMNETSWQYDLKTLRTASNGEIKMKISNEIYKNSGDNLKSMADSSEVFINDNIYQKGIKFEKGSGFSFDIPQDQIGCEADVTVHIPLIEMPDWVKQSSTDDDKKQSLGPETFLFDHFFLGILNGIGYDQKYYYSKTVHIKMKQ